MNTVPVVPQTMQMMGQPNRPVINPTICVGITAFLVGTAIGIGIGVLISNNRYRNNGFGGGVWFGKRRRRSLDHDNGQDAYEVIGHIDAADERYSEFDD
jgi:hypothetical protein